MDNNTRQNKDNVVNNYRTITKKDASTPSHTKYAENNKENLDDRNIKNTNYDDKVFEILGIKLHFDDILLICLIFFLYNEGVKDEYLFIALILLLLS